MKKISFIISNYNTKHYTKLCYDSIRHNLSPEHEIVLLSDASTDGTNELLKEIHSKDNNTKLYINDKDQIGIAYMYNKGVELASNEIVCVLHSDMYVPPKFDERMLHYMDNGIDFLTAYRVEPPIYPESNDKYQKNCGITWDVFDQKAFIELSEELYKKNKDKTQLRTCFPWMTTKTVYNSVGGNDTLFLKYMVDDDDFYYRIMLNGYNYRQALDVCVYHFCSRSTKYENDNINSNGSSKWNNQYTKSTRNFIRKWGFPQGLIYDRNMALQKIQSFKKCLILNDINNMDFIYQVEPYYDKIVLSDQKLIDEYIAAEQKSTLISLKDKFSTTSDGITSDCSLVINLKHNNITNEIFNVLVNLYAEINENSDPGIYVNNDMSIDIRKFIDNSNDKIVNKRIFVNYE